MRFALEVRYGRETTQEFGDRLAGVVEEMGSEIVSDGEDPDMVIAVGGDGTMLTAVRTALRHDVPVLGFNLGTLGFLAQAEPAELETVVARLLQGEYEVEERMTVMAEVEGSTASGVNDVVVEKVDSQRLVELTVSIDGSEFVTYRSDGLITATPTGSTAYAFSADGPLMDPLLEALILVPVASHSLFDRPLVLSPSSQITVEVVRDRSVHVTVDKTDLGYLDAGGVVRIRRGDKPARFVSFCTRLFSDLVKSKFDL